MSVRPKTIKFPKKNIGNNLFDISLYDLFVALTLKVREVFIILLYLFMYSNYCRYDLEGLFHLVPGSLWYSSIGCVKGNIFTSFPSGIIRCSGSYYIFPAPILNSIISSRSLQFVRLWVLGMYIGMGVIVSRPSQKNDMTKKYVPTKEITLTVRPLCLCTASFTFIFVDLVYFQSYLGKYLSPHPPPWGCFTHLEWR